MSAAPAAAPRAVPIKVLFEKPVLAGAVLVRAIPCDGAMDLTDFDVLEARSSAVCIRDRARDALEATLRFERTDSAIDCTSSPPPLAATSFCHVRTRVPSSGASAAPQQPWSSCGWRKMNSIVLPSRSSMAALKHEQLSLR